MKGFLNGIMILGLCATLAGCLVSCQGAPKSETADSSEPSMNQEISNSEGSYLDSNDSEAKASNSSSEDAIEKEVNQAEGALNEKEAPKEAQADGAVEKEKGGDEFAEFEKDKPEAQPPKDIKEAIKEKDEFADFDKEKNEQPVAVEPVPPEEPVVAAPPPVVDLGAEPPPPVAVAEPEPPPPVVEQEPPPPPREAPAKPAKKINITNVKYRANDNGGTIVIEGDGPMEFETRKNTDTNQFIVEIPNSRLPTRLKRPFNTRDMKGSVGSLDAYQSKGSNTSRIVVQLRPGFPDPVVQAEGSEILVVESPRVAAPAESVAAGSATAASPEEKNKIDSSQILSTHSLKDFMRGNMEFSGKKISIEVANLDIQEVFKLLSEEIGMNIILTEDVKGPVSLKLRDVPWDQAIVAIMNTYRLGYTRSGNIIRVAPIEQITKEEKELVDFEEKKKDSDPLKVKMVPISYAKVEDLATQLKPFMSKRGSAIADARTSSIILSDVDENIERALKLIASIDIAPSQVLIEGKIVEASDDFQKNIGVNWNASGKSTKLGNYNGTLTADVTPDGAASGAGVLSFSLGTLDVLGSLNATLSLFEKKNEVKVLSSPRIMVLHNEKAEITQNTQIPITTMTVVTGQAPAPNVSFKDVKLSLQVTPQITNDGAVVMQVNVTRDFLGGAPDKTTGAVSIHSRTASTKVMVKNAQTAVIGGIYQSDSTFTQTKVPWIADIPILGWLFKSQGTQGNKTELLIFLTPRIVSKLEAQN